MQKTINPSEIKALAIDLDGTSLLPDTNLGDRTVLCLKRLLTGGMQIILCTGRLIAASRRFYTAIGAQGPMVFCNGAEVAEVLPELKMVSSRLVDLDVIDYGLDLARSMDVHFQVFFPPQGDPQGGPQGGGLGRMVIEKRRPESEMYEKHTGITPLVVDIKTLIAEPELQGAIKAMFIAEPALHDTIRQKMLDRFGSRIYIVRTFPTFLEVMADGVSKGEGLKIALEYRGIKPEQAIAFGDEENDLPMFSVAGFSAAPSSAKEKVRQAADFVFGSNAEEGLAVFLEDLFAPVFPANRS